jgi:hypothetical protein
MVLSLLLCTAMLNNVIVHERWYCSLIKGLGGDVFVEPSGNRSLRLPSGMSVFLVFQDSSSRQNDELTWWSLVESRPPERRCLHFEDITCQSFQLPTPEFGKSFRLPGEPALAVQMPSLCRGRSGRGSITCRRGRATRVRWALALPRSAIF